MTALEARTLSNGSTQEFDTVMEQIKRAASVGKHKITMEIEDMNDRLRCTLTQLGYALVDSPYDTSQDCDNPNWIDVRW